MTGSAVAAPPKKLVQTGIINLLISLAGKTQADIAREIGVKPQTLNGVITGLKTSERIEKALATRFGVRREALFVKVAA